MFVNQSLVHHWGHYLLPDHSKLFWFIKGSNYVNSVYITKCKVVQMGSENSMFNFRWTTILADMIQQSNKTMVGHNMMQTAPFAL